MTLKNDDAPLLLDLQEVTVWRESTCILDSISLNVPTGRHTAVLGPNGSGKTSLLKLLLRQFYPSITKDGHQGRVFILGQEVWHVDELRRKMGVVSSALDQNFLHGRTGRMTVTQAIASGFTANELSHFGPRMTLEVIQAVDQAAESLGIASLQKRQLHTLSTGERRRALIARAMVHRPSILVLDEPTSGLDIAAQHLLLDQLRQLASESDLTMLLVTHHIEELLPEINHVVWLKSGRVVFDGNKREAITEARLSGVFDVPIEVNHSDSGWYSASIASSR
ncbi:putative ABC transporter ATP-binding protein YlmA [Rubripirellula amarantea]|uniref:Putative ABC transporter ATP-binding protein YlmA n=1 Tax=Rubripirellula amarantea TaxID=2527999 RepID=A0A5C5WK07_9BACT|nr:ATP-binding cassette domain-containing protein [Rubripirellula amarantea]TWT50469.1 putative ABC transporter ATP-binding protein YlmA [Rubripirellula amarantea]